MTKKELELISLNKLKKYYTDFPIGEIIHTESPDFLITNSGKTIGFEIVSILQENSEDEIKLKAIENTEDYIISEARKICIDKGIEPLEVHIHFGNCPDIVKSDKKNIAGQLAKAVIENLPPKEKIIELENRYDGRFPDVIHSFSIVNYSCLKRHHWSTPRAGFVQEDFLNEMQLVIDSKNEKYDSYIKKCDECFLLIDAPGDAPSSFFDPSEETKTHIYKSKFAKTFYVGGFLDNYFQLTTEP